MIDHICPHFQTPQGSADTKTPLHVVFSSIFWVFEDVVKHNLSCLITCSQHRLNKSLKWQILYHTLTVSFISESAIVAACWLGGSTGVLWSKGTKSFKTAHRNPCISSKPNKCSIKAPNLSTGTRGYHWFLTEQDWIRYLSNPRYNNLHSKRYCMNERTFSAFWPHALPLHSPSILCSRPILARPAGEKLVIDTN